MVHRFETEMKKINDNWNKDPKYHLFVGLFVKDKSVPVATINLTPDGADSCINIGLEEDALESFRKLCKGNKVNSNTISLSCGKEHLLAVTPERSTTSEVMKCIGYQKGRV